MSTCLIISAMPVDVPISPQQGDFVVAADAGYRTLQGLGITPDLVVGDFDSLGFVPTGVPVERRPERKDDTDTMLAIRAGLEKGCSRFLLYGATGGRTDHTIANFHALAFLNAHGVEGYLVGREMATIAKRETLLFPSGLTGIFSVFAWGCPSATVSLQGCCYPFDGELSADFPLGVSNAFTHAPASVTVKSGEILVMWNAGVPCFPRREAV
ncbi:MAG: thiamine diphosphokinase [Sphaerochaeta sp.]|jgi:thiamine pyrophosphokinase|nr:thiamine diphosphokinase [Sphaerochaeta sp.]